MPNVKTGWKSLRGNTETICYASILVPNGVQYTTIKRGSELTPDEFWAILHAMPEPMPVFFRLYYNEDGAPIHYTMEDLPGTYIDIDAKTYATASLNVRVQDGKLIQLANKIITKKLVPSATGTPCHPDNVAIVVSESQPHQRWKLKTYETD